MKLFNFVDNHDVERISGILKNPAHIPLAYGLLFAIPGTPCIYYGSEWGITGKKAEGDTALRPALAHPEWTGLTDMTAGFVQARLKTKALRCGTYRQLFLTNGQFMFSRNDGSGEVIAALNAAGMPYTVQPTGRSYAHFDGLYGAYRNLLTGETFRYDGGVFLPPESVMYLARIEN
jgi:glycosidase